MYVSLNGIAPYQDTGLDFIDYLEPPAFNFYQIEPTGGPTAGGTPVTIRAQGLDALGRYAPPATGDARCRWGRPWMVEIEGDVIQYTDAVAVDGGGLVCPTLTLTLTLTLTPTLTLALTLTLTRAAGRRASAAPRS